MSRRDSGESYLERESHRSVADLARDERSSYWPNLPGADDPHTCSDYCLPDSGDDEDTYWAVDKDDE